ncbi:MAG: DUF401 family protein [Lentisphaerae bacterium]|nr:DUF401 family protein [Lentisphaerota bacterium]
MPAFRAGYGLVPAILKIVLVFAGMLALTRVRVPLGLALMLGGPALTLWAGCSAALTLRFFGAAWMQADLWLLLAITVLIIEIGRFMTEGRNAEEIVAATRRWGGRHGAACSLMALPAMIGLVPMPGGALFSAPFVRQTADLIDGRPAWRTAVNYWFRHVWEYWWPLYPGVIVAMSLFEMLTTWQFIAVQLPFTPVAVAAGYLFLVRPHVAELEESGGAAPPGSNWRAFLLFLPLLVVVAGVLLAPFPLRALLPGRRVQLIKLLSVLSGLVAGLLLIVAMQALRRERGGGGVFAALRSRRSLNVLFILAGVLVFKAMLEDSGLLPLAGRELAISGIPVVGVVAALPFLAGMVTGLAVGFTGTSFPVVVGLLNVEGSSLTPYATLVLAFGFGYMGMMLSPVHLCLLVTREYFAARLAAVYRLYLPCVLTILVFCLLISGTLGVLGM